MPYISNPSLRAELDEALTRVEINDPGVLNFSITRLCDQFLCRQGLRYEHLNTVIGVLECAKLEMYRRVVGPYEDERRMSSGDVYRSLPSWMPS